MIGHRSRVAGLILPRLKVHYLRTADAEDDLKHFQAGGFLRHPRVKAGAALLDKSKVKPGRKGDRLDVIARIIWVVTTEVANVSGNRGVETRSQARDCVREHCAEIGIGGTAVAGPPASVHCQLPEVCEPPDLLGSRCRAAGKGSERIQIDTPFTFRMKVCIKEVNVTLFIVGIVGDILRLVAIADFKRTYVAGRRRIDSSKLRVLLPEVGFNNLGGSQKLPDGRV